MDEFFTILETLERVHCCQDVSIHVLNRRYHRRLAAHNIDNQSAYSSFLLSANELTAPFHSQPISTATSSYGIGASLITMQTPLKTEVILKCCSRFSGNTSTDGLYGILQQRIGRVS